MPYLPRLDRQVYFDERSRNYGVRELLPRTITRKRKIWGPRNHPLDQGQEGACVGFSWTGELAATPQRHKVNNVYALDLYESAQAEDRLMGNNWDEGASVLAGAKAAQLDEKITEYRWAFGIDEVIDTICTSGPVVLGINWYDSMYGTGVGYTVKVRGSIAGGHAIMANGYEPDYLSMGPHVMLTNSWGVHWGKRGRGYIPVGDLDMLLREQGEACIPRDSMVTS